MASADSGFLSGLFWVGLLAFFFLPTPLQREHTVYEIVCANRSADGRCTLNQTSGKTTYRIDIESQAVTYWAMQGHPALIQNCAIRDAKNWSCKKTIGNVDFLESMDDGAYSRFDSSPYFFPSFKGQLSWWEWRLLWAKEIVASWSAAAKKT